MKFEQLLLCFQYILYYHCLIYLGLDLFNLFYSETANILNIGFYLVSKYAKYA